MYFEFATGEWIGSRDAARRQCRFRRYWTVRRLAVSNRGLRGHQRYSLLGHVVDAVDGRTWVLARASWPPERRVALTVTATREEVETRLKHLARLPGFPRRSSTLQGMVRGDRFWLQKGGLFSPILRPVLFGRLISTDSRTLLICRFGRPPRVMVGALMLLAIFILLVGVVDAAPLRITVASVVDGALLVSAWTYGRHLGRCTRGQLDVLRRIGSELHGVVLESHAWTAGAVDALRADG